MAGAPAWRVKRNRAAAAMPASRGEVNQEMICKELEHHRTVARQRRGFSGSAGSSRGMLAPAATGLQQCNWLQRRLMRP